MRENRGEERTKTAKIKTFEVKCMATQGQPRIVEHTLPITFQGKFPMDVSKLSELGFDKVTVSKNSVEIRKNQSTDLAGTPYLFFEIILEKNCVRLKYSVTKESDEKIRNLHATLALLRVLSLFPKTQEIDASEIAKLVAPQLETVVKIAGNNYELVSKRYTDLKTDFSELSMKNRRLSIAAEESAQASMELERRVEALTERIKKLEKVSDSLLREMIIEWILARRGSFNPVQFAKANQVTPQRAEEGLEILIKSGAVKKVADTYAVKKQENMSVYEVQGTKHFDAAEHLAKIKQWTTMGKK